MEDSLTNSREYSYFAEVNTVHRDMLPIFVNQMNQAIIRQASSQKDLRIQVVNHPFPMTKKIKGLQNSPSGVQVSFFFMVGLSFIPASIITFIVKERGEQVKHLQLVSGVSIYSYWFSNYLIDLAKYVITSTICLVTLLIFQVEAFTAESRVIQCVTLLFYLFGYSMISFTYLTSFLFKVYGSAQVSTFFLNFFCKTAAAPTFSRPRHRNSRLMQSRAHGSATPRTAAQLRAQQRNSAHANVTPRRLARSVGSILSVIVYVLRMIKTTRSVGLAVQWILRLVPP